MIKYKTNCNCNLNEFHNWNNTANQWPFDHESDAEPLHHQDNRLRRFQPRLTSASEIFIPDIWLWHEKSAPENGVALWRRFLERVSWV